MANKYLLTFSKYSARVIMCLSAQFVKHLFRRLVAAPAVKCWKHSYFKFNPCHTHSHFRVLADIDRYLRTLTPFRATLPKFLPVTPFLATHFKKRRARFARPTRRRSGCFRSRPCWIAASPLRTRSRALKIVPPGHLAARPPFIAVWRNGLHSTSVVHL